MLTIGIAACLINVITIIVGIRYFRTGEARTNDKHVVAAIITASAMFLVVYVVALTTDVQHLVDHHPASVLWVGFDFYVAMLHLSVISYVTKCRFLRAEQEIHR